MCVCNVKRNRAKKVLGIIIIIIITVIVILIKIMNFYSAYIGMNLSSVVQQNIIIRHYRE